MTNARNPFAVFNKLQKFRQFASFILIFEQCDKRGRSLDHAENMMEGQGSTLAPMVSLSTVGGPSPPSSQRQIEGQHSRAMVSLSTVVVELWRLLCVMTQVWQQLTETSIVSVKLPLYGVKKNMTRSADQVLIYWPRLLSHSTLLNAVVNICLFRHSCACCPEDF